MLWFQMETSLKRGEEADLKVLLKRNTICLRSKERDLEDRENTHCLHPRNETSQRCGNRWEGRRNTLLLTHQKGLILLLQNVSGNAVGLASQSMGKALTCAKKVITAPAKSNDGIPRKRGRPPGTETPQVKKDGPQRKRGRPKGSRNKSKILGELQLDSNTCNHVKGDSSETECCETMTEDLTEAAAGHTGDTEKMSGEGTSRDVTDKA